MDVTIHTIEVPTDNYQLVEDASAWLTERLGEPPWKDKPRTAEEPSLSWDPTLLLREEYSWDAYVNPADFRAFFRIKNHDDVALLFKLTFGGKNDNQ